MAEERKLPVGVQSFEVMRNENYLYVDKTEYIWNLSQMGRVYFLSRPRRFGKSLLISTMEAYFEGRKDLFEGLNIKTLEDAKGENAWQAYPVIRFSLSGGDYHTPDGLADMLGSVIQECCQKYSLTGKFNIYGETLALRFKLLIERLYEKTGRPVVVLVDEYDKPLLSTMLVDEEQEERNRRLYKGFFSVLKDEDQYLKFVFFTGVTKFSKISIFSDLNQLKDISLNDNVAGICGITEQELIQNFQPEISAMADKLKIASGECAARLARMYDGYHFSPEGEGVYNPFSLLNAFQDKRLRSYWFETGTPEILIRKLEKSRVTAEMLTDGVKARENRLTDYRIENADPLPLFYQSGYLTIKGYDDEFQVYTLAFPNREVKYGFLESLLQPVLGDAAESGYSAYDMIQDLRTGDVTSFLNRVAALFASVPYPEGTVGEYEREWKNQIYLILALLGQNVQCEVHSAEGRADCIAETADYVYIFEFKLDKTADEALAQIEEKGYAMPYRADRRKVYKIGVNFSTEKRNIAEWKVSECA